MFFSTTTPPIPKQNSPFEHKVNVSYEVRDDLEDVVR